MSKTKQPKKTFELDADGFLLDPKKWEPALAEDLAPKLGILKGLS